MSTRTTPHLCTMSIAGFVLSRLVTEAMQRHSRLVCRAVVCLCVRAFFLFVFSFEVATYTWSAQTSVSKAT